MNHNLDMILAINNLSFMLVKDNYAECLIKQYRVTIISDVTSTEGLQTIKLWSFLNAVHVVF